MKRIGTAYDSTLRVAHLEADLKRPPQPAIHLDNKYRITIYNSSLADGSRNPDGLYNHGAVSRLCTTMNTNVLCADIHPPVCRAHAHLHSAEALREPLAA